MMICNVSLYEICWAFILYSFIGWVVEVVYHVVRQGIVVNRGFLNGPVCPVYGFGMLAVILMGNALGQGPIQDLNFMIVFFGCAVLATLVELIAGVILDVCFHARWWDYRDVPFNLNGYICLMFSILWGLGGTIVVRYIYPLTSMISASLIPQRFGWWILLILYTGILTDFIVTISMLIGLNKMLKRLDEVNQAMRLVSDNMTQRIGGSTLNAMERFEENRVQVSLAKMNVKDLMEKYESSPEQLILELENRSVQMRESLWQRFTLRRVLKAFPGFEHREYQDIIKELKERKGF